MPSFHSYRNPSLAADLVVFGYQQGTLSILLLNRNTAPFKDQWVLPGAFLLMEERLRDTCARILKTKLGMDDLYLEQLCTYDEPDRDPRGRAIAVAHYALVNPARFAITAGTMANDVKWFNVKELPPLGFDHDIIAADALKRLQHQILYYPVGFELLNDLFTMPELHELYECILDINIDRRNFRRKILDAGYIINTGNKREGLHNRHPDLYQFNKELKSIHLSFG
ncbi:NUDIX domain-containing protein [Chitinophaga sancti]|uniref:NUDIX hydrolase n=1 Tax=Chitinophaga sancti TaxID=1004 RepID=UPI002A753FA2|nr:NUDIX domain-containing protein [Chitinophaga sancti]WPQ63456.1 NUDIX domain-containing protein [Chitinophaga sancti]